MTLKQLRTQLNTITNYFKSTDRTDKVEIKVNEVYDYIVENINNDANSLITSTWNNRVKALSVDIDLLVKDRDKIKNKKIKGKNIFDRINRNRNKLIIDTKRILKKKESKDKNLATRISSEYRSIKRIVRTDSHRMKESTKNFFFNRGNKIVDLQKDWVCVFRNSRDAHKEMHGQTADSNGNFTAPTGEKTKYPGGFGVARLDINCQCYTRIRRVKNNGS